MVDSVTLVDKKIKNAKMGIIITLLIKNIERNGYYYETLIDKSVGILFVCGIAFG